MATLIELAGAINVLAVEVSRQAQEDLRCLQAEVNAIISCKLKIMNCRHKQLEQHRKLLFPELNKCNDSNSPLGHRKPSGVDAIHGGAQVTHSQQRKIEKAKNKISFSTLGLNAVDVAFARCSDVHEAALHNPPRDSNTNDTHKTTAKATVRAANSRAPTVKQSSPLKMARRVSLATRSSRADQTNACLVHPGLPSQSKGVPVNQCPEPKYSKSSTFLQDDRARIDDHDYAESSMHFASASAPDFPPIDWKSHCDCLANASASAPDLPSIEWKSRHDHLANVFASAPDLPSNDWKAHSNHCATQHDLPLCHDYHAGTSDTDVDDVAALAETRQLFEASLDLGIKSSLDNLPAD